MKVPFFGASYQADSPNLSADEAINLYPEVCETGTGKNVGAMRGTPGLRLFANIPTGPIRGLWSGEGRLFAAAGNHAYEILPGTPSGGKDLGVIDNGPGNDVNHPVQFFPNGNQLLIISNEHVYVYDGSTLTEPTFTAATYNDLALDASDPTLISSASTPFDQTDKGMQLIVTGGTGFTPATYKILSVSDKGVAKLSAVAGTAGAVGGTATETPGAVRARTCTVLDTYAIIAPSPNGNPGDPDYQSGNNFYISQPNDFSTWMAIDVAAKEGYPDHILSLLADHGELYVFGDLESTEVWRDTGNSDFPFERDMGAIMHYGLAAQYSVAKLGFNGVAWLAWSVGRGPAQAVLAQGFNPQRISTHAIEAIWRTYPTVGDAEAYSYIEDGHQFYVIHFPSGDATWVYDLTASQQLGKPMWHRRGWWDGTTLHRQRQRCHAFGYLYGATGSIWDNQPVHFVGDHENGNIYAQSLQYFDDAGAPILRRRTCSHVGEEGIRAFWSKFQLDAEVGNQPLTATLDYSRDGGHTFINPKDRSALALGNYAQRLIWWRLGTARDIVFRVTIMSPAKVSLINGYAESQPGNS